MSAPRILVTRPAPQAARTAEALSARGLAPLLSPLSWIEPLAAAVDLDGVDVVLVTSSNGAVALARATARRDVPVLAVGARTAEVAREQGFEAVSADGDAADLARLAAAWPGRGALLHARGEAVARSPLVEAAAAGRETREAVLYRAVPAGLSVEAQGALDAGEVAAALAFSPKGALALAEAVGSRRTALGLAAISAGAAAAAGEGWAWAAVAARPDEAALLDALGAGLGAPPEG